MKRILTIAGSDSCGGAGIQADLKTIAALGGYGMSAVTALTAQNTLGVTGVHAVPPSFVAAQIEAVLSDVGADAVKTGMLQSAEIVSAVARTLERHAVGLLVVDPVTVSETGHPLLELSGLEALKKELLPLACVVTPNLEEAAQLVGHPVKTETDMAEAADEIGRLGPRAVLVKGGHLDGEPVDILWDGRLHHRLRAPRVGVSNTHGTGCALSAALATLLALHVSGGSALSGEALVRVSRLAKGFVWTAIAGGTTVGAGHGTTDPFAWARAREVVLRELEQAMRELGREPLSGLVPEVRSNLGYALPCAPSANEVAAFPGRITGVDGRMRAVAAPAFGVSRHVASVILAAMDHFPEQRSAMNIRCDAMTIAACQQAGLRLASFDRGAEPPEVRVAEGSSLEWGTSSALAGLGEAPDVIYDLGGPGKEPMIRVLGRTPGEVVSKVRRIGEVCRS